MEWNAVVKRVEITKDTVAKGNRKNRSESDTITGPISDQIGGAEQIGPSDEPSGTELVSEVRTRRCRETLFWRSSIRVFPRLTKQKSQ